jgi:hypothetical protein
MFSVRRCAVTVTSISASLGASPAALVSAARATGIAAQEAPLRMAATAYEIFEFIVRSLQYGIAPTPPERVPRDYI